MHILAIFATFNPDVPFALTLGCAPFVNVAGGDAFIRAIIPLSNVAGDGDLVVAPESSLSLVTKEEIKSLACSVSRAAENVVELGRVNQFPSSDEEVAGPARLSLSILGQLYFGISRALPSLCPFRFTCWALASLCCEIYHWRSLPCRAMNTRGVVALASDISKTMSERMTGASEILFQHTNMNLWMGRCGQVVMVRPRRNPTRHGRDKPLNWSRSLCIFSSANGGRREIIAT